MKKLFSLLFLIGSISPLFGQIYNQTSPLQVYSAPSGGAFGNILFQGAPPQPIGPATLTYYYRGDLDSPGGNEFFDLLDENSNFIAQSLSASQCNPQFDSLVLTIPAADIAQWASNGQIGFSFLAGSGVNGASLCTDPSGAFVKIRYQYQTGGNFCPGPFGLNVINVDTANLTFGWTTGGSNVWNVQYGPAGFQVGNGTVINNVVSNPFTIGNLQKGNTYDFYVQDSCLSTSNASFWSGPLRVTVPIAAPYYQGFDSVNVPQLPFGWLQHIFNVSTFSLPSAVTANGTLFNEPIPFTPPNCGKFDIVFGTSSFTNDTIYMITPPVYDLFTNQNRVRFKATSPGPQFMEVGYMMNPTNSGSFTSLATIGPLSPNWEEYKVNFTGISNANIGRIAFKYYGTLNSSDGFIEDVYWEKIPEYDAGVIGFDAPGNPITLGNQAVEVAITNYGIDTLTNVNIGWDVNGVTQTPFVLNLSGANRLPVDQSASNINIGNFNFTNSINVVRSWTSLPNSQVDEVQENDTALTVFCSGLTGTYTAGQPGDDFPNLDLVFEALNGCGLVGPTEIVISGGDYLVKEELNNIQGLNATNTLTFRGIPSDTAVLRSAGGGNNTAVLLLDSVTHITFKNLTIQNEASNIGRCIQIRNQSSHIHIDSCRFIATNPLLTAGLQVVGVFLGPNPFSNFTEGDVGDHIIVENSDFFNLEQAVHVEASFQFPSTDIQVLNNFVTSGLDGAFRFDNVDSLRVEGNTIEQMAVTTSDGIFAEDLHTFWFNKNEMYVGGDGIVINRANDTTSVVGEIINNIISADNFNGISTFQVNFLQIYHNSVEGQPTLNLNQSQSVDCRNNIFISDQGLTFQSNNSGFVDLDHNIYTTGGTTIASNNGAPYTDLADFQFNLPIYNTNSYSGDPLFNSPVDFRITYGLLANDVGDNSVPVGDDIDGDIRPASGSTNPDIGADEFTPPAYDLALNQLLSQRGFCFSDTDSVEVEIINYGLNNLDFSVDSFMINWSINGPTGFQSGMQVINTDTLASGDTASFMLNQTVNLNQYGTYYFNAYISSSWDSLAINDSIVERPINVPVLISATGDTSFTIPGGIAQLEANSPVLNNVLISEVVQFKTGTGQTSPYPTFVPTPDWDMVEIANVGTSVANLGGYTFEMYDASGLILNYTIPTNASISAQEVLMIGYGGGNFSNQPNNNLYWATGAISTSSNVPNGYILRDLGGNIVDAVATNGFIFPAAAGVTASDWSGNIASSSGLAGVFRTGTDNNTATDWSLASTVTPMTIGAYNPNLDTIPGASLFWHLDTVLVDTVPSITQGPFNTNGTYSYVASIATACGIVYDTVVVDVNIPYPDTGLVDVVVDSVGITDDVLCEAAQTGVKMYLTNTGTDTIYFIPAGYSLNGTTPFVETIIDTLYPNIQTEVTFSGVLNLPSTGSHSIQAWVIVPGDTTVLNDSNSTTILNRTLPAIPSAINDTTYCPGEQVSDIWATGTGGLLTWYSSASLDTGSIIATTDTITPSASTGAIPYYVTETDQFGCESHADTVVVGQFGYPNASAGGNTSVCQGGSKTIIATGGLSYVWSNGSTTQSTNISPTGPTTLSVTVTDGNGCVAADTISVSIDTLPNVTLAALASVCANSSSFTLTGGLPAGGNYSGNAVSSGNYFPSTAGPGIDTVYYSFTNSKGCSNTTFQTITVNNIPNVNLSPFNNVCANGAPVTLTGGSPAGGVYGGPGVSGNTFDPTQAGGPGNKFITYTITDGNGCTNTASQALTTLPPPNVTLGSFPAICENYNPFALQGGKPTGGTYTGNGVVNDTIFPAIAGAGSIVITYEYTSSNGCSNVASRPITIDARPAQPNILSLGQDSLIASINAPFYQWYFQNQVYPGNGRSILAQFSGFYQVEAINGTCTSPQSERYYYELIGTEELVEIDGLKIFPNPTNGAFTITGEKLSTLNSIQVISLNGQVIKAITLTGIEERLEFELNNLSEGIYILVTMGENGLESRYPIVKQ